MTTKAPERGDLVWINFSPQAGHEQAGQRPALVLSPITYNRASGLALFCPITSRSKGYPYELELPDGLDVKGVILCDHIRSMDWETRGYDAAGAVPEEILTEVRAKVETLI